MRISTVLGLALALFVSGLSFSPRPAAATFIELTAFTADMQLTVDPRTGNQTLSLLVNSRFFGADGIAGGLAEVGLAPPDDGLWLAGLFGQAPPDDATPAINFLLDPGGEVMGVEPSPFRIFLTSLPPNPNTPADVIGELDFSDVTGNLGSLNLDGVVLYEVDALGVQTGVSHTVLPFTLTQAVPEPNTAVLMGLGLVALAVARRHR